MSSLGLSLLILIVLAIAALAAYNFWTNRSPRTQNHLNASEPVAARNDSFQRQEPSFSVTEPAEPADASPQAVATQPQADGVVSVTDWQAAAGAQAQHDDPASNQLAADPAPQPAVAKSDWVTGSADGTGASDSPADQGLDWRQASQFDPTAAELEESARAPADEEISDQLVGEIEKTLAEVESAAVGQQDGGELEPVAVVGEPAAPAPAIQRPVEPAPAEPAPVEPAAVEPDQLIQASADGSAAMPEQDEIEPGAETIRSADPAAAEPDQPTAGWAGIDLDRSASKYVTSVSLELPQEMSGADLLTLTAGIDRAGTKPIRVSACSAPEMPGHELKTMPISAGASYGLLRFELLQVNRQGPVDGVEYSEFVRLVSEVGDKLGVLVNVPDMNVVLIRSRVLDAEVASLDAQVAVNVETEQPIDAEQFAAFAREQNLQPVAGNETGNKFLNISDDGWTINSVEFDQAANRIVMILDVPTIPRELQPIRQMVECAWKFAQAYDGKMIDDSGRLIDNPLFERIESQLDIHYQALLAAGVPAGSDLARQVYNSD
ncbi:MAG: hypothetical protein ACRBC3_06350 [Burkholderiaceae bacterium]